MDPNDVTGPVRRYLGKLVWSADSGFADHLPEFGELYNSSAEFCGIAKLLRIRTGRRVRRE